MADPAIPNRLSDLIPGIIAATCFAISNVLSKIVMAAGSDVLTLSLFRGLVGVALLFIWLRIGVLQRRAGDQQDRGAAQRGAECKGNAGQRQLLRMGADHQRQAKKRRQRRERAGPADPIDAEQRP